MSKQYFTKQLMHWHESANNRDLPWKEEKDPYKIWLSEVILQQTRAEQGLPYYLKFIDAYPTITRLAKAQDEKVYRLWQGLGYYNRCKNMLITARLIVSEHNKKFPDNYEDLLKLKGIGPYTASAIASFAYNLPRAVVDGNVYRVLSRYFDIETPIDSTEGKKQFALLANELLEAKNSSAYNQAIMDLGATICTPKPKCNECPLQKKCSALIKDNIELLPVKSKKLIIRKRYFHYILFKKENKVWIHKRPAGDIWENLYEPFFIESEKQLSAQNIKNIAIYKKLGLKNEKLKLEDTVNQKLTHQYIKTRFFSVDMDTHANISSLTGKWVATNDLKKYAFPKTVLSFLENNFYF